MDIVKQRINVLKALVKDEKPLIVLSVEALLDRLVKMDLFKSFILNFEVGSIVDINQLMHQLLLMGYERSELVESPGQFALRGGIVDVYPSTEQNPYRIEFWDDEVDSIRLIDPISQRSLKIKFDRNIPMRELVFTEEVIKVEYLV